MKIIFVVHVTKYSLRHMPEFTHIIGDLEEVKNQMLKHGDYSNLDTVHAVIAYASKLSWNAGKDFELVHTYQTH